jgi:hypothetical protein
MESSSFWLRSDISFDLKELENHRKRKLRRFCLSSLHFPRLAQLTLLRARFFLSPLPPPPAAKRECRQVLFQNTRLELTFSCRATAIATAKARGGAALLPPTFGATFRASVPAPALPLVLGGTIGLRIGCL